MGKVRIDGLVDYKVVPIEAQISVPNRFSNLYTGGAEEYYSFVKERIARAITEQLIGSDLLELVRTDNIDETIYKAKLYFMKEVL